jgi:hypothetical protein
MATLDINDVTPEVDYTATAAQTVFTVPFEFFADTDLVVLVNNAVQSLNVDYTVTGAEVEGGGSITFTTGLSSGDTVRIYTDIAIARDVKYVQSGNLSHNVLERDMAKNIRIAQQLERDLARSVRLPKNDPYVSMELADSATRASTYLAFDSLGALEHATDVTPTTLTRSVIGGYLYPRSDAEIAAGVDYGVTTGTIVDRAQPYSSPRRYGAMGDGVTDDTVALQTTINVASYAGSYEVDIPYGHYLFSTLYVYYDVSLNSGFNPTSGYDGRVKLSGDGQLNITDMNAYPARIIGTVLYTNGSGILGNSSSYGFSMEDITLAGDNATYLLNIDKCPHSRFKRVSFLVKNTAGNGVYINDCHYANFDDCNWFYDGSGASTGDGLQTGNSGSGGIFTLRNCSFNDFYVNYNQVSGNVKETRFLNTSFQDPELYNIHLSGGSIFALSIDGCHFERSASGHPSMIRSEASYADLVSVNNCYFLCQSDVTDSVIDLADVGAVAMTNNYVLNATVPFLNIDDTQSSNGVGHVTNLEYISGIESWTDTPAAYILNDVVSNGGLNYICVQAGTSAPSPATGPSGTGTGIPDGTVEWDYYNESVFIFTGIIPKFENCVWTGHGNGLYAEQSTRPFDPALVKPDFYDKQTRAQHIGRLATGVNKVTDPASPYRPYQSLTTDATFHDITLTTADIQFRLLNDAPTVDGRMTIIRNNGTPWTTGNIYPVGSLVLSAGNWYSCSVSGTPTASTNTPVDGVPQADGYTWDIQGAGTHDISVRQNANGLVPH